ncbi:MAG: UDP-2,3-diacylglucosamine diphosphatase [Deltaproteobacteria bacterium]|nr:UDP-2,3-diacylglucosamine diphosphatase [Deltaproteobacteria bacterium]
MKIVFIADAHIKGLDDPAQKTLCGFLENLSADRLVIMGDLFDFWAGFNDVLFREYSPLLSALSQLRKRGIEITYLEGNHDFSMGDLFTGSLGVKLYPDSAELTLNGKKAFLSHGDMVDRTLTYALWRGFLRSFLFKALAAILPAAFVWKTARALSRKSRASGEKYRGIENHLKAFAREKIGEGYEAVVLAHSHIPALDIIETNGKKGVYVNPGSWTAGRNYIVYENGEFRLER